MQSSEAGELDTPINRATVATLDTMTLEKELDEIRERRLALRVRVETLAKVKTEKADLTAFIKFDKLLATTKKGMEKLDKDADALQQAVNKLRALVLEMGV